MTLDILMPFYGRFDHFRIAVESVLAQTDPDWRLTIVDDVYPDLEPGRWAQGLDDDRVHYVRNEQNLRPSRNYNKSIGLVTGEFVVLMGCDDVMLPGYVARVRELIELFPASDIVQPGVAVIDGEGHRSFPMADRVKSLLRARGTGPRTLSGEALASSLLRGNWTYFPSLAWRRDRLAETGFRTDLDVVQDLAKLFELTASGSSMTLDDSIVFEYRRHSTSVSAVAGPDGSKFVQERTFFYEAESVCGSLGWTRAARIARHHVSSRLNALTELPSARGRSNRRGRRTLLQHVLRRPYTAPPGEEVSDR